MSGLCLSIDTITAHVSATIPISVIGVTHIANRAPHDVGVIHVRSRRDLAGNDRDAGRDQRLAGDAAVGILREEGIQTPVGNLVGQAYPDVPC